MEIIIREHPIAWCARHASQREPFVVYEGAEYLLTAFATLGEGNYRIRLDPVGAGMLNYYGVTGAWAGR